MHSGERRGGYESERDLPRLCDPDIERQQSSAVAYLPIGSMPMISLGDAPACV
jgi:hypothetical protein